MFHSGSNYDYYFIIKEVAEEFEDQFEFLEERTKKYIIFSVPTKKTLKTASSLSSLADNLSEGLHKDKCKNCKSDLEYVTASAVAKDTILIFKCVDCNESYEKTFYPRDVFKSFRSKYIKYMSLILHTLCWHQDKYCKHAWKRQK